MAVVAALVLGGYKNPPRPKLLLIISSLLWPSSQSQEENRTRVTSSWNPAVKCLYHRPALPLISQP